LLGKSNLPLIDTASIFKVPPFIQINENWYAALVAIAFVIVILFCFWWFLRTDFGIAIRATGNNPTMVRAMGINPALITIISLGLANGLTALSGFLMVQYQRFADINMGIGVVITGLGSVLIGDALLQLFKSKSILVQLLVVVLGSIFFQLLIAIALSLGLNPSLLKLITALLVLIVVTAFKFKTKTN
jgi:putative ABC transport system permease protein